MEHRRYATSSSPRAWQLPGAFAVAVLAACGQGVSSDGQGSGTNAAYEALSAKLQPCIEQEHTCAQEASGDQAKLTACATAAKTCRDAALTEQNAALSALKESVTACFTDARGCAADGTADSAARDACRSELRSCLKENSPPLPPCLDALQTCLQTPVTTTTTTTAGSGGGRSERVDQIVACAKQAHTCIVDKLPELPAIPHAGNQAAAGESHGSPFGHGHAGAAGGRPELPNFPTLPPRAGAGGHAAPSARR